MQQIQLDKHIKLLDSPGIVMANGATNASTVLRNCVKVLKYFFDYYSTVKLIVTRHLLIHGVIFNLGNLLVLSCPCFTWFTV